jgi:hypothetical protein
METVETPNRNNTTEQPRAPRSAKPPSRFCLNGFRVQFSKTEFTVFCAEFDESDAIRNLRAELGSEWFFYRRGNRIYGLPKVENPARRFGSSEMTLSYSEHEGLSVLVARLNDVMPDFLPRYVPLRRRPFRFLARKNEFVQSITRDWRVPEIVRAFKITPRFQLEARIIEMREGTLEAVLVLSVATQWEIAAQLLDLSKAGIPLEGQYVIRRNPEPNQRLLVGRIGRLDRDVVHLDESPDNCTEIRASEVQSEGSKAAFKQCLSRLLGTRHREFDESREHLEAEFLTGPAIDLILTKMREACQKRGAIPLTPGLAASVGEIVTFENEGGYQTYVQLPPVEYCFDAAKTKRHEFAWEGLREFGPFDRDVFENRSPRVLVVTPQTVQTKIEQALRLLRDGIPGTTYSTGFARLFNLLNPRFDTCMVPDQRVAQPALAEGYR